MPLLDLQKSLRMLGKIRMGEKKRSAQGKEYPSKLAHWRLTSPSYELLEVAAQVYGGEVGEWRGAPTEGAQYEVFTTTDRLQVVVPPANALIQSYEQWNAGGCARRCDGVTEELSGNACMCPADADERARLAAKGNACKITSRLKVLLPDIPDIGVWMLESHGYYAAVELAGFEEIMALANVRGQMIPAQLRIDQRTVKRPKVNGDGIETRHYAVPVLELVSVNAHQLARGEVAALGAGGPAALPAASAPALPSGPRVAPRLDRPESRVVDGGGPPLPPLPHEEGGVSVVGASGSGPGRETTDRPPVNRVAIAAREAGLDDDGRHDLAEWASDGRVRSSAELTQEEANRAITTASNIGEGRVRLDRDDDGKVILRDKRFGWRTGDPRNGSTDTLDELTKEAVLEMKGPQLVAALRERNLPLAGKVDELRERLLGEIPF